MLLSAIGGGAYCSVLAVSGGDWRLSAILAVGMCGYTAVPEDGHTCYCLYYINFFYLFD